VAFRIAGGRFELDGKTHQLTLNNGPHHLHGGTRGFSSLVWEAEPVERQDGPAVKLALTSPDGDQGYPGNLHVTVVYTLTHRNELAVDFAAATDRPTPINLTHHGYFNLAGPASTDVRGHVLRIDADRYSPLDDELTPTGTIESVEGTPLDFTNPTAIGARQDGCYDLAYLHNHGSKKGSGTVAGTAGHRPKVGQVLRTTVPDPFLNHGSPAHVATAGDPETGRVMEVHTTAPAVIFYSGVYLDGTLRGKNGAVYPKHAGLCLETGHLPDSVHHAKFPSTILRPGETYRHRCIYRFGTR
jgi:aldose 1-epimerase